MLSIEEGVNKDLVQYGHENGNLTLSHYGEPTSSLKVLLIFSNPVGSYGLRLQNEEKVIRDSIRNASASVYLNKPIEIVTLPACTIDDLSKHLMEKKNYYDLIHFSGHTDRINLLVQHIQQKIIETNHIQKGDMDQTESLIFRRKLESLVGDLITNVERDYANEHSKTKSPKTPRESPKLNQQHRSMPSNIDIFLGTTTTNNSPPEENPFSAHFLHSNAVSQPTPNITKTDNNESQTETSEMKVFINALDLLDNQLNEATNGETLQNSQNQNINQPTANKCTNNQRSSPSRLEDFDQHRRKSKGYKLDIQQMTLKLKNGTYISFDLKHYYSREELAELGVGSLAFECEKGTGSQMLLPRVFANLLHEHQSGSLQCVVLNACGSHIQAEYLRDKVPVIVYFETRVSDVESINFSKAFYSGLATGSTFKDSFKKGQNYLDLHALTPGVPQRPSPVIARQAPADRYCSPTSTGFIRPFDEHYHSHTGIVNMLVNEKIINDSTIDLYHRCTNRLRNQQRQISPTKQPETSHTAMRLINNSSYRTPTTTSSCNNNRLETNTTNTETSATTLSALQRIVELESRLNQLSQENSNLNAMIPVGLELLKNKDEKIRKLEDKLQQITYGSIEKDTGNGGSAYNSTKSCQGNTEIERTKHQLLELLSMTLGLSPSKNGESPTKMKSSTKRGYKTGSPATPSSNNNNNRPKLFRRNVASPRAGGSPRPYGGSPRAAGSPRPYGSPRPVGGTGVSPRARSRTTSNATLNSNTTNNTNINISSSSSTSSKSLTQDIIKKTNVARTVVFGLTTPIDETVESNTKDNNNNNNNNSCQHKTLSRPSSFRYENEKDSDNQNYNSLSHDTNKANSVSRSSSFRNDNNNNNNNDCKKSLSRISSFKSSCSNISYQRTSTHNHDTAPMNRMSSFKNNIGINDDEAKKSFHRSSSIRNSDHQISGTEPSTSTSNSHHKVAKLNLSSHKRVHVPSLSPRLHAVFVDSPESSIKLTGRTTGRDSLDSYTSIRPFHIHDLDNSVRSTIATVDKTTNKQSTLSSKTTHQPSQSHSQHLSLSHSSDSITIENDRDNINPNDHECRPLDNSEPFVYEVPGNGSSAEIDISEVDRLAAKEDEKRRSRMTSNTILSSSSPTYSDVSLSPRDAYTNTMSPRESYRNINANTNNTALSPRDNTTNTMSRVTTRRSPKLNDYGTDETFVYIEENGNYNYSTSVISDENISDSILNTKAFQSQSTQSHLVTSPDSILNTKAFQSQSPQSHLVTSPDSILNTKAFQSQSPQSHLVTSPDSILSNGTKRIPCNLSTVPECDHDDHEDTSNIKKDMTILQYKRQLVKDRDRKMTGGQIRSNPQGGSVNSIIPALATDTTTNSQTPSRNLPQTKKFTSPFGSSAARF